MTQMKSLKFIVSLLAAFLLPLMAMAADPFTVVGVKVDATGQSAIEAQTKAIQGGQLRAATIVLERLTLDSERASNPLPPIDQETAAKMIRSLGIDNERRSATRYLGDISVAFKPRDVQAFLRSAGLNMIASQAGERVVLPFIRGGGINPQSDIYRSWLSGRYTYSLTPAKAPDAEVFYNSGMSSQSGAPLMGASNSGLRALAQALGAEQLLFVEYNGRSANVMDFSVVSGERYNFTVSDFDLNRAVIERLESDWKTNTVSLAEEAVSMPVSILYESQAEWQRLKTAINGSAQIQDARLDAVSKDGALMTLTYAGNMDRLTRELAFKGVTLRKDSKLGMVLTRAGRR